MKLYSFLLFAAVSVWSMGAQTTPNFNLDLEEPGDTEALAKDWVRWGSYPVGTDEETVKSGETSAWVASGENGGSFGSIAYRLPANYEGEEIRLEGYIKTEAVEEGFAGLLLRIDGNGGALEFDNMQKQNLNGTNDWKQYSINLPFPEEAENIYVGGLLSGKGKAWFDGFRLTIDGKDVQTLKTSEKKVFPADLDKEFDTGSKINIPELNEPLINDLALLGRVWGFLKYHHPEVAKGNYNWDYELFRILPKYLKTKNSSERDQLLVNWIDELGEVEACQNCKKTSPNLFKKADHSWMKEYNIGMNLREKLEHVYNSNDQDKHYYIGFAPGVNNPEFKNQKAYENMPYPDEGFRLLSLFRYWNMIEYFFPNKHLVDKDWDQVLKEYIPAFVNAENELEYEMAAVRIIGDIKDTHANLWGGGDKWNDSKGNYFAPVRVEFVEDQLVVTDYYNPELKEKTGLEIGDVITHIEGKPVEAIVNSLEAYYPASNVPTRLRNISMNILRSPEKDLDIKFISENGKQQKRLQLYERDSLDMYGLYRRDDKKAYKLLDDNIGYVTLASIKDSDVEEIKKEFKDTDGIIIDIRNYPSAFVPFSLGSWFATSEKHFVRFSNGSLKNPGEFTLTEPLSIPGSAEAYKGKLVILLNEITQSQAEYTAMAFKAGDNTTIIGSTTAGADGNVSAIMLPGGLRTMISGIGVYYPDGRETQRVGILPDVEVKPSIQGIREGRDELLEKAVEVIKNKE